MDSPSPYVAPPAQLAAPLEEVLADLAAARAHLEPGEECWLPVRAEDLRLQGEVEADLAREGLDRTAVGAGEVGQRLARCAAGRAEGLLAGLATSAPGVAGVGLGKDAVRAARTAFVALYEAGLVDLVDQVATHCPRCDAVLGPEDQEAGTVPTGVVSLALVPDDGGPALEVETVAPELLAAVSGVGVPPGHPAAGARVPLPVDGRMVPVLEDPSFGEATLLTPAHDPAHRLVGLRLGLPAPVALASDGSICAAEAVRPAEGSARDGMARFAARAVAVEEMAARGVVVGRREEDRPTTRCRHCGTVAVQLLGAHWTLAPADGRPGHLVGRDLGFGPPVPVSWCIDCGKPTVKVTEPDSCGMCMGGVRPDDAVLDAYFVAAAWAVEVSRPGPAVFLGPEDDIWLPLARRLEERL